LQFLAPARPAGRKDAASEPRQAGTRSKPVRGLCAASNRVGAGAKAGRAFTDAPTRAETHIGKKEAARSEKTYHVNPAPAVTITSTPQTHQYSRKNVIIMLLGQIVTEISS
jgi:hypothetical protein